MITERYNWLLPFDRWLVLALTSLMMLKCRLRIKSPIISLFQWWTCSIEEGSENKASETHCQRQGFSHLLTEFQRWEGTNKNFSCFWRLDHFQDKTSTIRHTMFLKVWFFLRETTPSSAKTFLSIFVLVSNFFSSSVHPASWMTLC